MVISMGKSFSICYLTVQIEKNVILIKVIEKIKQPKQHNGYLLHIVIVYGRKRDTKNISRFEWFLEKSTEIGIDEMMKSLLLFAQNLKERRSITKDAIKL